MTEQKPNAKQQECIDNIEGQYLVLAGPGTGKTFTVSRRIENMVNLGIDPEKILCLTFSETAANEMKKKIDERLEKIESEVNVYTYHGFCNDIISNNIEEFDLAENYKLISSTVERNFVKECIDELNPKAYRTELNDPYRFLDEILKGIHAIKQNRLKKEAYFYNLENNIEWVPQLAILEDKKNEALKKNRGTKGVEGEIKKQQEKIEKAKELWDFYELYQEKLTKYHYIDYNDMIGLVLDKFEEDDGFLARVANEYEYLLVDEYQDTNPAQNDVVFNLCRGMDKPNVFVVGDDDQIVYTFQGARLDTMERFLREFPKTKVICLQENMRSTQSILDAAREVAKQDYKRLENNEEFKDYGICKDLVAKNEDIISKDKPVRFYKYVDGLQEQLEIVKEIEALVNSDDCPTKDGEKYLNEIAILTRSNAELETFAQMLKGRNIPCELKEGKSIFQIKSAIVMYYYMQMLVNPELHADKIFRLLLNPPFDINIRDYKTLYEIKSDHKAFLDCIRDLKPEQCQDYGLFQRFIKTYDDLRRFIPNESLKNCVLEIGAKTGIFNYYLNSEINRCENIAGLKKLTDEAKNLSEINKTVSLEDFVEYLDTCLIDDIDIKTDKAPVDMNAVQLSTYHSSKGKEYEYVYMPTMFNTKWEDKKANKARVPLNPSEGKTEDDYNEQKNSDAIKTLYVGMTRAKHTLRLSYYSQTGSRTKLTQYIANIQDMLEKEKEPFEYDENAYWQEMNQSILKRDYDYNRDFNSVVDMRLKNRVYSPTFLNDYKKCPRNFLYTRILGFDSPAEIPDAMNYGTAIHNTLDECLHFALKNGKYPTKEEMIAEFKTQFAKQHFSSYKQKEIMEQRGLDTLEKYYHHFTDTPLSTLYGAEENVTLNIDGYDFVGKIDRIEQNEDGMFSIYDYKTGKAKGKSEIGIGKSHEDYYNQIGFYKYLYEKKTGNKVSKTEFIFPEFPENNFSLELTNEQCEAIKDDYIKTIEDIKAYKFDPIENRNPNSAPCKFCAFYKTCKMEMM